MQEKTEPGKISAAGKVRIVVDHREANNHVFAHLKGFDAELECEQLKTGDYICSDRVAIERKTASDFVQSIIDRRVFRQASEIAECFEKPLLIIEGDPERLFAERNVHPNAIRGALASLAIDYKIPIIWTRDAQETASQIYWIAYREQEKGGRAPSIRCPAGSRTPRDMQEFLVAGLPGVNTKLGRNLLKKFKTPRRVFSASQGKLMKVEGVGEKKAMKIWELLNTEHPRDE
jgi:Fanconi anemia group M protein